MTGHVPCTNLLGGSEQTPSAGNAFEIEDAAFSEFESRAGNKIGSDGVGSPAMSRDRSWAAVQPTRRGE